MVQVSAPGATSRARCTRRSPLLRDALFATSPYPSAEGPRSGVKKRGEGRLARCGPNLYSAAGWRTPQFGVILVAGLDRLTLTPVRRSAEGVASRRPTCESQAQSYAPQGAPLTLRLPPVVAGSPFAHRAPDITAVRLLVCAAPESQAETLLAHLGQDALMALLTEATEGDGYVDIKHAPVRFTLNLQKRTEPRIERFGMVGHLFGLAGRDLAFLVERVQPDPDPTKDAV